MSCTSWRSNIYDFSTTNNLFNKPVLNGTFAGYSGSSVIPTAKNVSVSGSTDCNVNINNLTKVTTSSSCVSSNWLPIVSDCGCSNIFGGYGCCGGWGSWGLPATYFTRSGQANDNIYALNTYSENLSYRTLFDGTIKEGLASMGLGGMLQFGAGFISGLTGNC